MKKSHLLKVGFLLICCSLLISGCASPKKEYARGYVSGVYDGTMCTLKVASEADLDLDTVDKIHREKELINKFRECTTPKNTYTRNRWGLSIEPAPPISSER